MNRANRGPAPRREPTLETRIKYRLAVLPAVFLFLSGGCNGDPEEISRTSRIILENLRYERSHPVEPAPEKPSLDQPHSLAFTWLGHASVLLEIGGSRILVNPVLSERVQVFRRMVASPLAPRDLPPMDFVLLTDAHYDHLDRRTLKRLDKRATIITPAGSLKLVADLMFRRVITLKWGESYSRSGITIQALEAGRGGRKSLIDPPSNRRCNVYLVGNRRYSVFLAAAPADSTRFAKAAAAAGNVDLALLPAGAPAPGWLPGSGAPPKVMIGLAAAMNPGRIVPIQHSTFLFSATTDTALARFKAVVDSLGLGDRVMIPVIGRTYILAGKDRGWR